MKSTTDIGIDVQVEVAGLERAARALAVADSKNWEHADVRNRYRGLVLTTVAVYLTTAAAATEVEP